MRPVIVNGERGGVDWLQVQPDGSIVATGFFDGGMGSSEYRGPGGQSTNIYSMGMEVPERVGGLMIFHDVPLTLTADTPVLFEGKPLKVSSLDGGDLDPDPGDYMFVARFVLEDGWVRATSIRYTSQPVRRDAWPDEFPPESSIPNQPLPQSARPAAQPGIPWLDVSLDSRTPYQLVGNPSGGTTSSDRESGVIGNADVAIPDRVGPAVIYHLAQVFYSKAGDMPHATEADAKQPFAFPLTKLPVRLFKANYFGGPRLMGD